MFKWNVILRDTNGCRSNLTVTAHNRAQAVGIARKAIADRGSEIAELISVGIV